MKKLKFAEQLKFLREDEGLSQNDFAKLLNISKQTVSAWERGTQETDYETLIKIALFFNVSVDYLLGLVD